MRKTNLIDRAVGWALILLMLFPSCTPSLVSRNKVSNEALVSESRRMISEYYDEIRTVLVETGEYSNEEISAHGTLEGEEITRSLYESAEGEKYMNFLYETANAGEVEQVLSAAEDFLSTEEMSGLRARAEKIESVFMEEGERISRSLAPSDKEEFYSDLRSLTVKSIVLLTAAVIYAVIPNVMFWGKVSAATAISVAAGILASTAITVLEWSDKDVQQDENAFKDWLDNVTSEPVAAWAIAEGVITTQTAAGTSAVAAALILGVFAVYHITDGTKKILKNYNWKT